MIWVRTSGKELDKLSLLPLPIWMAGCSPIGALLAGPDQDNTLALLFSLPSLASLLLGWMSTKIWILVCLEFMEYGESWENAVLLKGWELATGDDEFCFHWVSLGSVGI